MEPEGAPALGSAAASLGAVLMAAACGMTPAPSAADNNKENGVSAVLGASTRGNVPAVAAPSALKAEASASALGRAPSSSLAAEDSYDTAGCARDAGAAHAGRGRRVHLGGARH